MASIEELAIQFQEYISKNEQKVTASSNKVEEEMGAVQRRVSKLDEMIRDGGRGEGGGKGKSLIYVKMITPTVPLEEVERGLRRVLRSHPLWHERPHGTSQEGRR